jgi:hypothetical protein
LDYIKLYVAYFNNDKSLSVEVFPYVNLFKQAWNDKFSKFRPLFIHAGISRPTNDQIISLLNSYPARQISGVAAKYILQEIVDTNFKSSVKKDDFQFFLDSNIDENEVIKTEDLFESDESLLRYPLSRISLSVRSRNCLAYAKISTLGDLAEHTERSLRVIPNFGTAALEEIKTVLAAFNLELGSKVPTKRSHIEDLFGKLNEPEETIDEINFKLYNIDQSSLESVLRSFKHNLSEREFEIFSARVGLDEKSLTLEAIGQKFNVSRERIRQVEAKVEIKVARIINLINLLDSKLYKIRENLFIPLYVEDLPNYDSWFEIVRQKPWVMKSLLNYENLSSHNVQIVDDDQIIGLGKNSALIDLINHLRSHLDNQIGKNYSKADLIDYIRLLTPLMANEITNYILSKLSSDYRFSENSDLKKSFLVSAGRGAIPKLIALLESSDRPLSVDEIYSKLGLTEKDGRNYKNQLVDNDLFYTFDTSIYGIRKHLNLTDPEIDFVNSVIKAHILENGSERQWHANEIYNEANFTSTIKAKLNAYKIIICILQSDDFSYLGRFIFVLGQSKDSSIQKINYVEMIESLLEKSDEPLTTQEIKSAIEKERGLSNVFQIHDKKRIIPLRNYPLDKKRSIKTKWALIDKHLLMSREEVNTYVNEMSLIVKNNNNQISANKAIEVVKKNPNLNRFATDILTLFYLCERNINFTVKEDILYNLESEVPNMSQVDYVKRVASKINEKGIKKEDLINQVNTLYGKPIPRNLTNILHDFGYSYDQNEKIWYKGDPVGY